MMFLPPPNQPHQQPHQPPLPQQPRRPLLSLPPPKGGTSQDYLAFDDDDLVTTMATANQAMGQGLGLGLAQGLGPGLAQGLGLGQGQEGKPEVVIDPNELSIDDM